MKKKSNLGGVDKVYYTTSSAEFFFLSLKHHQNSNSHSLFSSSLIASGTLRMITAARRGHASIARCLRLPPSTFPTTSNLALLSWKNTNPIARLPSTPASRAFSIASQWKQEAAVQSQEYQRTGNSTGGQSSQNPPQSKAQYGPVTKFAELGERNMVCPSIVDRITRDMKLETMTHVQSLTINETLKGIDVYA